MNNERLELYVANLDCEGEAAAIERGMDGTPGVSALKVYAKSAKVAITFDPASTSAESLKEKLRELGFPPHEGRVAPEQPKPWRNPKVVTSAISGILLLIGWLLTHLGVPQAVTTSMFVASILIGGYYFWGSTTTLMDSSALATNAKPLPVSARGTLWVIMSLTSRLRDFMYSIASMISLGLPA